MASVKELKSRLKSLRSTNKITSAMKIVAAAKLKRSKDTLSESGFYTENFNEIVQELFSFKKPPACRPYKKGDQTLYILFSSNRGLCGSFNASIGKFFFKEVTVGSEDLVFVAGKKIADVVKKTPIKVASSLDDLINEPQYVDAEKLAKQVLDLFLSKNVARVCLVYNHFVSSLVQKPTQKQVLPIETEKTTNPIQYSIEVNEDFIEEMSLKKVAIEIYQVFLNNAVGEHAARMTAMDSATSNAQDLINKLTIKMNRARQASITTELTEIVSGAESLKNG